MVITFSEILTSNLHLEVEVTEIQTHQPFLDDTPMVLF